MDAVHGALASAAAVALGVLLVVAVAGIVRPSSSHRAIDLVILGQLAVTGAAAAIGLGVAALVRPPADPLHLVYGTVALVAPVGARAIGHRRGTASMARWVAGGTLIALGATVRSFMTGG